MAAARTPRTRTTAAKSTRDAGRRGASAVVHSDSLVNMLTRLGQVGRDKSRAGRFTVERSIPDVELEAMYLTDGLAARIVNLIPDHALRRGFEIEHNDDPALCEALMRRWSELRASEAIGAAMRWARLYGGGAAVMAIDDGQDPALPLNLKGIRQVRAIRDVDRTGLTISAMDGDLLSAAYGNPAVYQLLLPGAEFAQNKQFAALQRIHASRVLRFDGFDVPRRIRLARQGWGGSHIERAYDAIRNWRTVVDSIAQLAHDVSPLTANVKSLRALLAAKRQQEVIDYFQMMALTRSVLGMTLVDAEDTVQRHTTPLAGVEQLVETAAKALAADTGLPISQLIGAQSAGIGQTHDADVRIVYDLVQAEQESGELRRNVERGLLVLMLEKNGATKGRVLKDWTLSFKPLWQPTESELVDLRLKQSQVDAAYIDRTVLDPAEVRLSRFGKGSWSWQTTIDVTAEPALPALPPPTNEPAPSKPAATE